MTNHQTLGDFDQQYRQNGSLIAGMDEAGRGPLAGPVAIAIVALDYAKPLHLVNDSKKLSYHQREKAYQQVLEASLYHEVLFVSAQEIDQVNIYQATKQGMETLLSRLPEQVQTTLIDYMPVQSDRITVSFAKADQTSLAVAAASILAKVTRDHLMEEYDLMYPAYGFKHHFGYGTKQHYQALKEFGATPIHRQSFNLGLSLDKNANNRYNKNMEKKG